MLTRIKFAFRSQRSPDPRVLFNGPSSTMREGKGRRGEEKLKGKWRGGGGRDLAHYFNDFRAISVCWHIAEFFWSSCGGPHFCGGPCSAEHAEHASASATAELLQVEDPRYGGLTLKFDLHL